MVVSTPQRTANGIAVAAAAHALMLVLILFAARIGPRPEISEIRDYGKKAMVWLADGASGGRGGSGNDEPGEPRPLKRPGHDRHDLPLAAPAPTEATPEVTPVPDPVLPVAIPVTSLGSGEQLIGVIELEFTLR
jgi:hypothetical protein